MYNKFNANCVRKKTPQSNTQNHSSPPDITTNNSSKSENKIENSKPLLGRNVMSYFYKIYPKNSGKPVDGLKFEEKDINNGYLRVTGYMEGYFVFALFKGKNADWVIEQSTSCGPECDQKFQVYKFENGRLSSKKIFENLFSKKKLDAHLAKLRKKIPKGHTGEDLQPWLMLPKFGTAIDILIVEQNPGHTSGSVSVYQAGKLEWNGEAFKFIPMNPTKPSSIEISNVH